MTKKYMFKLIGGTLETKRRILEKVIKRDGREVDYDNHKIAKAIGMAYTSVYGNLDKFGEDIGDLLRDIEVNLVLIVLI